MIQRSRNARPKGHANAPGRTEEKVVRIDTLAAGGAGVGSLEDGLRVFVPGTAPGEHVVAAIQRGNSPARGRLLRIVEPGPDRREPPCPHVESCGGCDFMHLSEAAQQHWHAEIVRNAVAHAIGSSPPPIRVHPAAEPLRYRTRARLFVRNERGRMRVGYRAAASHQVVDVRSCVVLDPSIAVALDDVPAVLAGSTGEGDVQIARGAAGRLCIDVVWRGELSPSAWAAMDQHIKSGAWAGARVRLDGVKVPATFGDPRAILEGADGEPLVIAAGSFAQPSDEGANQLARRVFDLCRSDPDAPATTDSASLGTVVELFSGSGTFSVLLARAATAFFSVEASEEAATAARQNLLARGLSGKVTVADADKFPIASSADVVVLDPPRSGAAGAAAAIASSRATRVVYVACDPATLSRDLGTLVRAGFALTHLETVELFPQTSHVETLARLVRSRGEGRPSRARRD
ncbi:MAG: class I SAM-dependent RNA methyltransferase [Polyangiaceae bacterium]|nr:class I SAM-dependent RNA methyltransferase [Polyangiaceae bacterium]